MNTQYFFDDNKLNPEEKQVAQQLHKLYPRYQPSELVDQRILKAAQTEITKAQQKKRRGLSFSSSKLATWGMAASVILVVGVTWNMRTLISPPAVILPVPTEAPAITATAPLTDEQMDSEMAPAAAEISDIASESNSDNNNLSDKTADSSLLNHKKNRVEKQKSPTPLDKIAVKPAPSIPNADIQISQDSSQSLAVESLAPEPELMSPPAPPPPPVSSGIADVIAEKNTAREHSQQRSTTPSMAPAPAPVMAPPAPIDSSRDAGNHLSGAMVVEPAAGLAEKSNTLNKVAPIKGKFIPNQAAQEDARLTPELWLKQIQQRVDNQDLENAKNSVQYFHEKYPDIKIPKNLNSLLESD